MRFHRFIAFSFLIIACLTGYALNPNDSIPVDTIILNDGSLYIGQMIDSLSNGQGRCIYADGTVYEGSWKDGMWDGQGTVVYPDGDIYKGEFHNHIKEGTGTYFYNSGAKYEGEWKDDRFNGVGKLLFEDGGRYEGAWKDDMKHGYGRLVSAEGYVNSGYFYYDEYLGMPYDTEIVRDSVLTDELKDWGFQQEPPRGQSGLYIGMTYGAKGMFTATLCNNGSDSFFYGVSIGLNIEPPTKGQKISLGWNTYSDDIHLTGEYISSQYMVEAGYKFKKLAIGGSVGFGIKTMYMNCRANGNPENYYYYNTLYGNAYSRRYQIAHTIVYRGYLLYPIITNEKSKAHLCLGYGRAEGLFLGVDFAL